MAFENVWNGRDALTESLDRDYADMRGDGWDLIWEPTSPLTTPWWEYAQWAQLDPDAHVRTEMARPVRRRREVTRILKDYERVTISQQGSHR